MRRTLTSILTLAIIATLPLAAEKATPPPGGVARDLALPARHTFELDNGLRATLVRYGAIPRVRVTAVTRVGNLNEAADEIWLNDFTGRMLSEGAGVFDEKAVEAAIRESFADWQRGEEPLIVPPTMASERKIHLVDRPGAPQSTIRLALPTIDPSHQDYMALQVTNTLLGGFFSSRITANLREDKDNTHSPGSSVGVRYRAAHWVESADVTTEQTGDSFSEIFKKIGGLQAETPPAAELNGVKNYMTGVFVLRNSSYSGITNLLSFVDLHGLDESYLTEYVKRVQAVTPEEVQRIAKEYLRDDEMTLVVVGDRKQVTPQVQAFGPIAQ